MRTLLAMLLLPTLALADGDPKAVSFERDVLPVLQKKCFACHDGKKSTSELRLDVRARAFKGGESGVKGIVPKKSADSEIFRRVTTKEESEVMPPKGERMTEKEVASLKAWIDAGANWPDALANETQKQHWAFVAPVRPPVPLSDIKHPIDAFVRARLVKEGLKPSASADKRTLIRRVYLDLIGLLPTPAEVEDFVKNNDPKAFDEVVEKLLKSKHYGERWGRLWLDAARYADSDGYEKDKPRFVYFYRDWVVKAFNDDLPYDQFLTEQLAGDLLPKPTQDNKVATGYLRNSMINEEGGIDPEQFRMEAMFDRMDAIGKGMLGLTIQCAQCHTHKFDPITHTEYYQLFAFLNTSHEANMTVYTAEELKKKADILEQIKQIENDLKHKNPTWREKLDTWAEAQKRPQIDWKTHQAELDSSGGQKHYLLDDGSILAAGYAPTKMTEPFTAKTTLKKIAAVRLEVLNDPTLPRGGPGRAVNGLFGLTEIKVEVAGKPVKIVSATADANAPERELDKIFDDRSSKRRVIGPVEFAFDGKDDTAWSIDIGPGRSNVPRQAVFVFEKPVDVPADSKVTVKLTQNHGGWNSDDNQTNNLGRFRISLTDATDAKADLIPRHTRKILAKQSRTEADVDALFSTFRTSVPEWKSENERIEQLWKQHPLGETQLTLTEMDKPRTTHLLKRGDFLKPANQVSVGTPAFLNKLPKDAPANRLGLAKWMTSREAPTTARAIVNRIWQSYFGQGLHSTPEDFGTQSDKPTHPELLDWLATELMEPSDKNVTPWSIKHLQRLIVTSQTYQQSSVANKEQIARDPGNKWLGRGPRFRVDAEVVRDVALQIAGLLDNSIGGPPVYPPIPEFLTQPPASYGPKTWPESTGKDRYRRSLYVFKFRSIPYPALQAFDAPTGDFSCVKRSRSNTPIQALVGLNETVFTEAAQALGLRLLVEESTDADRINLAYRLCASREATESEQKTLIEFMRKQKEKFSNKQANPWTVAFRSPDQYRLLPNNATPAELAAWVALSRVMLNLDETMNKE